jgi:hypothetical protein
MAKVPPPAAAPRPFSTTNGGCQQVRITSHIYYYFYQKGVYMGIPNPC